jgi:hypothetical protein
MSTNETDNPLYFFLAQLRKGLKSDAKRRDAVPERAGVE